MTKLSISWHYCFSEHPRIDAFELWCWRRLLRVPWTTRRSNQSILRRSTLNIHWKDWCSSWSSNTLVTWCKEPSHWKRPWCWERLKSGRKGDDRRWDGWMVSLTQWTWIWASSGRWWRTGKPRVLQSKGSWRVRHDLMIEQQQFFPTLYFITGTSSGYSSSLYMVNVCWWCSYKHLICKNYLVTLPTVISMIFVSFFFNWKSFYELFEYLSYWGFPGGSSS